MRKVLLNFPPILSNITKKCHLIHRGIFEFLSGYLNLAKLFGIALRPWFNTTKML